MDVTLTDDGTLAGPAVRALVGDRTGLVAEVRNVHQPRGTVPIVYQATRYGGAQETTGVGIGRDRPESLMAAVGETTERHCMRNWQPADLEGPRSFAEAADEYDRFVGYEYFDIYDEDALARSSLSAPDPEKPVHWVAGRELLENESCRLPREMVCQPAGDETERYFRSSNGMACGSTLVQAVTNGLTELVERDAMLRAWYTQTRPARIDVAELPEAAAAKRAFESDRYDVEFVSFPNDLGVATVGCVFTRPDGRLPAFALGMAADLDVQQACRGALREGAQIWLNLHKRIADGEHDREIDPDRCFAIEDGAMYYALPEHVDEVAVFTDDLETVRPEPTRTPDSRAAELSTLLERLRETGRRVICLDMTPADVGRTGFRVVRVVVPELVPMTMPSLYPSRHPRFDDQTFVEKPHPFA